MKINLGSLIKETGAQQDFSFKIDDISGIEGVSFSDPVNVDGYIMNTGNYLELKAKVNTTANSFCSRCLDGVHVPLNFDFTEQYKLEIGTEDNDDNSLVFTLDDDILDLTEVVKENIILMLPMSILCHPDCPGICPQCGCNLKDKKCDCQTKDIDPRLEVLAKFKKNI